VPIIQLHGSVTEPGTIVCTRSGYRRLLYNAPGYTAFIQALLATCTVLYLGSSLTDSYLGELRSATLSMLDWGGPGAASTTFTSATPGTAARPAGGAGSPPAMRPPTLRQTSALLRTAERMPVAYAVIPDQSAADCAFLRRHEGVHVLTWQTDRGSGQPADWGGFDRILRRLYELSNSHHGVGQALHGKRMLVLDSSGACVPVSRRGGKGGGEWGGGDRMRCRWYARPPLRSSQELALCVAAAPPPRLSQARYTTAAAALTVSGALAAAVSCTLLHTLRPSAMHHHAFTGQSE
jgi:hypothetical protein